MVKKLFIATFLFTLLALPVSAREWSHHGPEQEADVVNISKSFASTGNDVNVDANKNTNVFVTTKSGDAVAFSAATAITTNSMMKIGCSFCDKNTGSLEQDADVLNVSKATAMTGNDVDYDPAKSFMPMFRFGHHQRPNMVVITTKSGDAYAESAATAITTNAQTSKTWGWTFGGWNNVQ